MESVRSPNKYRPNLGFLGDRPVRVPNYLFRSDGRRPHSHARGFVRAFLSRPPEEHYRRSHRLTRFLRQRGMTFQKRGPDGAYRIFTVPVTSTVVPLPKSSFNSIEEAASLLVVSLRRVLQSLYGAASLNESSFAEYLPAEARALFLEAAHSSPHYLPRLHHPVMAEYPFMEQVGIDLVLVEEYLRDPSGFSRHVRDDSRSGRMPFRMLELNAGSPSGASNNLSILEGLYREDPELLEALGPMMPNDHFQVLRDVYQNIGRFWTGREDGVQVVLPPGGANGAAPEIHEISRLSGLPYCDSGQLFRDEQGWIRLRTLDGSNPASPRSTRE